MVAFSRLLSAYGQLDERHHIGAPPSAGETGCMIRESERHGRNIREGERQKKAREREVKGQVNAGGKPCSTL